ERLEIARIERQELAPTSIARLRANRTNEGPGRDGALPGLDPSESIHSVGWCVRQRDRALRDSLACRARVVVGNLGVDRCTAECVEQATDLRARGTDDQFIEDHP